ncbi:MAG: carbamoyltransferase C-terminal domain-containing protein, partial [Thermoplasmata archaeon]
KLNQRILELPCVDNIYVHPNMTDGGLATGAALYAYHNHLIRCGNPCEPSYLNTVYLGPAYNNRKIEAALRKLNVKYEKVKCTEDYVARALHSKKIVAHFFGRMEYGPRALGNRSILASPVDRNVNRMLNERLGRTEFMPFAPSILEDYADSCLAGWRYDHFASRFMTVTYNVTDYLVRLAPAVVHVDRTVRPHIVRRDDNPRFYSIIRRYFQLSAVPLVINTSFNMHGEPIVCTPEDAVRAYTRGAVDAMAIGDYWVDGE